MLRPRLHITCGGLRDTAAMPGCCSVTGRKVRALARVQIVNFFSAVRDWCVHRSPPTEAAPMRLESRRVCSARRRVQAAIGSRRRRL